MNIDLQFKGRIFVYETNDAGSNPVRFNMSKFLIKFNNKYNSRSGPKDWKDNIFWAIALFRIFYCRYI